MYYIVISCTTTSHSGVYKSIQECMSIVDMWEDIYENVRWNITKATKQRGVFSPRQNKINRKK